MIGAYGFIGQAITRQLLGAGHRVSGVGRSARVGASVLPDVHWLQRDLAHMHCAELWSPLLSGVQVVVNASGALQDGARDNLRAVQDQAIQALISACEQANIQRFVQISAVGADPAATTRFMRTKARADLRLQRASLDWVILRPGLVIGAGAYGGTALLRMLAMLPLAQPLVLGSAKVHCVSLDEVAALAARAAEGGFPPGTLADLVETQTHTLRELVTAMGRWLGRPPPRWQPDLPMWCARLAAFGADLLGHLGWRSPLRSTAMRSLEDGATGDPSTVVGLLGQPLMSLEQIFAHTPATLQDRWFARLYLALPLIIASLTTFWVLSGVIALWDVPRAANWLPTTLPAAAIVITASIIDITLGLALLYRPWARWACWGMVTVTLAYLAGATLTVPQLWSDPLGPLIKPIPAMVLAMITPALLVER